MSEIKTFEQLINGGVHEKQLHDALQSSGTDEGILITVKDKHVTFSFAIKDKNSKTIPEILSKVANQINDAKNKSLIIKPSKNDIIKVKNV